MPVTHITYVPRNKMQKLLEKDKVGSDLRLPKILKDLVTTIIIYGQSWGRRGNTKLIAVTLFTNELNDNKDVQDKIEEMLKKEEPGCSVSFHPNKYTLVMYVTSKNLTSINSALRDLVEYLINDLGISKREISLNISTDLVNWTGVNYYVSDVNGFINVLQATRNDEQCGKIYLDPDEVNDTELYLLVQSALAIFPRIIIKLNSDEIGKEFLISKLESYVFETQSQLSLDNIHDVIKCEVL